MQPNAVPTTFARTTAQENQQQILREQQAAQALQTCTNTLIEVTPEGYELTVALQSLQTAWLNVSRAILSGGATRVQSAR